VARAAKEKPLRPPQKVGLLRIFKAAAAVARYCARNAGRLLALVWFPCLMATLCLLALDFLTLAYPPRLPGWLLSSNYSPPTWLRAGTDTPWGAMMWAFVLADMIGDADLNIDRESNSAPWLQNLTYEAATRLGYQSHFFARTLPMDDDHIPFVKRGVPSIDLIDFTYGYNNVFWHTSQDTIDKLSPQSLKIVGMVMLESVRMMDTLDPLPPK